MNKLTAYAYGIYTLIQIQVSSQMSILYENRKSLPIEEKRRRINEISLAKMGSTKVIVDWMKKIK